jgi:WD40 repeat protein
VYSVAFSTAGDYLLSGGGDSTARLWAIETGREVRTANLQNLVYGVALSGAAAHAAAAIASGFSNNDTFDRRQFIIWDLNSREILANPRVRDYSYDDGVCIAYSLAGDSVLCATRRNTIRLCDAITGRERMRFKGHTQVTHSLAFLPDGRRFISGSEDGTVRVWDIRTGTELAVFHHGSSSGLGLRAAILPDGRRAVSGGWDGYVRIWRLPQGPAE